MNILKSLLIIGTLSVSGTVLAQSTTFSEQPFTDVPTNSADYQAIEYLRAQNVIKGYLDGTFRPNATINRAEFVEFIINPFILDTNGMGSCVNANASASARTVFFSDVAKDAWYAENVCFAKTKNLINGYPDGSFRPGDSISFAEAAKIISNVFGLNVAAYQTGEFWFRPYVQSLSDLHAIPTNIRRVNQTLSRADMAQIVYRLQVDSSQKANMGFNASRNTLFHRNATDIVATVPTPAATVPTPTPASVPSTYRSQTGRRAMTAPTRGVDPVQLTVRTTATERQAIHNILSLLGRIALQRDSMIAFQELTSHTCFEPIGTEIDNCQKRFGRFYHLKQAILNDNLYEIIAVNTTNTSHEIAAVYQAMVAEIRRNDAPSSLTVGAVNTMNMRDRMQQVWEWCQGRTTDHRSAMLCYVRNDRQYLDFQVLTEGR